MPIHGYNKHVRLNGRQSNVSSVPRKKPTDDARASCSVGGGAQNIIQALLEAGYRGAYPKRLLNEVPTSNEHFTYTEIFKAELEL